MPQCTLISTATSFNMSHARLMTYSSLAGIGNDDRRILPKITRRNLLKMLRSECLSRASLGPQSFCWIGREFAYTAATFARRNDAMTCNSSCNRRRITTSRLWHRGTSTVARGKRCPRLPFQPVQLWQWECALETCIWSEGLKVFRWRRLCELCSLHALACNTLVELKSPASAQTGHV